VNWSSGLDFTPRLGNHSLQGRDNSTLRLEEAKNVAPICSNFAPLGLEKHAFSRKFMSAHLFDIVWIFMVTHGEN